LRIAAKASLYGGDLQRHGRAIVNSISALRDPGEVISRPVDQLGVAANRSSRCQSRVKIDSTGVGARRLS
jgi:hypothetical protein